MKRKIISIISVVIISLIAVSCENSEVPPVITDLLTDPVTDTFTEPITEPVTEPVTEPITEPVTEPITEPITELVTDPITDPVTTDSEVTEAPTETAFDRFKALAVKPQTVPQASFEGDGTVRSLTVQEQDALLRDLLYKGADGFVHIKGAESIRLPIDGEYSALPAVRWGGAYLKTPEIFVYHKLNTTVADSSIPAYHAGGTNGINEVVKNNGVYGFCFSKSFVPFPDDVIALFNDVTARVIIENWYMEGDRGCAVIHASKLDENRYSKISVILTTTDGGENINVAVCDTNFSSDHSTACTGISFVSDTEGYLVFERMYWSMGRFYHVIMKTSDGGKTFVFFEDENNGYTDMGKNAVFFDSNNYVNVGYFYNGIPKDLIRRGTVGVDAEAMKTSYYIPDESEWRPDNEVDCRVYPMLAVMDGYTPYFDGDIGVIAFKVKETSYSQAVGPTGYIYYISLNRGYTWSLYTGFENEVK